MAILKYFNSHGIISFNKINQSLAYLRKEFHLKLSFPKVDEKLNKLPGKSDEVWHFSVLLPHILINVQGYDSPVWNLFSAMLEMCRIITISNISLNQITQLSHLIKLYFEYLKESFPNTKL